MQMSGRNFDKTFTLGHLMHEFKYVKDKNKDAVLQYLNNVSGVSEKDLLAELKCLFRKIFHDFFWYNICRKRMPK